SARVWDAASGKEVLVFRKHGQIVTSVCYSPDGGRVVSGAGDVGKPGEALVWDAATGEGLHTFRGHTGGVMGVSWHPDGERVASCAGRTDRATGETEGEVRVWSSRTGQELFVLRGQRGGTFCVAFSPDGGRLASASSGEGVNVLTTRPGELKVW